MPRYSRGFSYVFFTRTYMRIHSTVGQHNRSRGLITWSFCSSATGQYFAVRNDGKSFPYSSIEEMRDGYRKLTTEMRYAQCCPL